MGFKTKFLQTNLEFLQTKCNVKKTLFVGVSQECLNQDSINRPSAPEEDTLTIKPQGQPFLVKELNNFGK